MDIVGGFGLTDGTSAKALTGLDDHSRFCVSATLLVTAMSLLSCLAVMCMNAPVTFCGATVARIHASLTFTCASALRLHKARTKLAVRVICLFMVEIFLWF